MIIYFADRGMNILGQASNILNGDFYISDDKTSEDVDSGVSTFEVTLTYNSAGRKKAEECSEAGNYLLKEDGNGQCKLYTIIDETIDIMDKSIELYAEDAGMDLLNNVVAAKTFEAAHSADYYIEYYIKNTGFEIGINEASTNSLTLSWDGEATMTERLASIATKFGSCEISYSFTVEGLKITHKYVNVYEQRGNDNGVRLFLGKDISSIVVKKSVADVATSYYCTGGTKSGSDTPITLKGYEYDDGDYYVDGKYLRCRSALEKWNREASDSSNTVEGGHLVRQYSYDTKSQKTLCKRALTALKKVVDTEVNYEIEFKKKPDGVTVGDTVYIVDDAGELYMSARMLTSEYSDTKQTFEATFGDYVMKSSGISSIVSSLSDKISTMSVSDDYYISITSSSGNVLDSGTTTTVLTAHIYVADEEITDADEIAALGVLTWYKDGVEQTEYSGQNSIEVSTTDAGAVWECRLISTETDEEGDTTESVSGGASYSVVKQTATGENIYWGDTEPDPETVDIWFDTANGNAVMRYNSETEEWEVSAFGTEAIANVAAGAIQAGTIYGCNLEGESISIYGTDMTEEDTGSYMNMFACGVDSNGDPYTYIRVQKTGTGTVATRFWMTPESFEFQNPSQGGQFIIDAGLEVVSDDYVDGDDPGTINITSAIKTGGNITCGDKVLSEDHSVGFKAGTGNLWANNIHGETLHSYGTLTVDGTASMPKKIVAGTISNSTAVPAGDSITIQVSSAFNFDSTPRIFYTIRNSSAANRYGSISCITTAVSTTGFTVGIINASSSSATPSYIDWVAVV